MNQRHPTAALVLGAIALSLLTHCAANTATTNSSPVSSSPAVTLSSAVATPAEIAQNPASPLPAEQLSVDQKNQLSQLSVPVLVPTFLPAGFRLTKFDAGEEQLTNGSYSYYSLLYQGDNNTCLEISTGVDPALSTSRLSKALVTTPLGEATVYSGEVEGRSLILSMVSAQPQEYMLRSGLVARPAEQQPDGSWSAAELCQPVSMETYTQVLRSLRRPATQFTMTIGIWVLGDQLSIDQTGIAEL
ncbi:MAG: hypothetical protein HC772_16030, partial [Leptolyngbyaceae cyanobacterium CRU_2_3]|nr:hypothetical protein [Leptolyngbyaceae cyanobacterium CRU_2_3]